MQLVQRLFQKDQVLTNLTHLQVSFPLLIFCNDKKHQDYLGETIDGFAVKFCDDFFLTPTDVGICMTKNLKTKNVINYNLDNDYVWYIGTDKQNEAVNIGLDNYWARNRFVLPNNAFAVEDYAQTIAHRTIHKDNRISMQIHSENEFAEILHKNKHDTRTTTISLKPGYKYTIQISPKIQESSDSFKNVPLGIRPCLLEHEAPNGYSFKKYSKNNCLYECHVSKASDKCKCIPWDFFQKEKHYQECDIFGRTCFFAEFDNLTHFPGNICSHCLEECNKIEFHRKILKEEKLSYNVKYPWQCSEYLCYDDDGVSGKKEFLDYLSDKGNKIMDSHLKNITAGNSNTNGQFRKKITNMNKNMIVVDLKYQSSNVDVTKLDVRYSLSDKIANFGGTFGIWAELTRFYLLGIINIFIISFKLLFESIKKDH